MVVDAPARNTPRTTIPKTLAIREQYPNPCCSGPIVPLPDPYCVGGAFMRYYGIRRAAFPGPASLAETIQRVTTRDNAPLPSYSRCYDHAVRIIALNDSGRYDEAWQALEEALA